MKRDLVAAASALLKARAGLHAEPTVRARLARCLDDGAARLGLTAEAYLARIEGDSGAFQELLDRVTVQHSSFFRDPNQFAALSRLLAAESGPGMIWSAACGNGQEPYSLAMLLEESGRQDWRVLATDVSSMALARVRAGRYTRSEVAGLSEARLRRFFTRSGNGWEIASRLRERVEARVHNLSESRLPMPGATFSIIFCRNVLIYFDAPLVRACVERLAASLPPGGHLFLGFSESLPPDAGGLALARVGEAYIYRKGPAPVRRAAPARRATPPRPDPTTDPLSLLAEGEREFAAGNSAGAVRAFRKVTYLEPDQPVGFFQLGTALEHSGDPRGARRAFAAAESALERADPAVKLAGLEGYSTAELGKAIAAKLGEL